MTSQKAFRRSNWPDENVNDFPSSPLPAKRNCIELLFGSGIFIRSFVYAACNGLPARTRFLGMLLLSSSLLSPNVVAVGFVAEVVVIAAGDAASPTNDALSDTQNHTQIRTHTHGRSVGFRKNMTLRVRRIAFGR